MLTVTDYAEIRHAYYLKKQSMRQIEEETGHSYWTIRKALEEPVPRPYQQKEVKEAPILGPFKEQIQQLLRENEKLPGKQRYTSRKIYQAILAQGYVGAESTVRHYVSEEGKKRRRPQIYLPLSFDPGMDAQADWGEAWVEMGGERMEVNLFVMRLCYSRKLFVMAFPTQRQESFFLGHVQAFGHFGGVPQRISYDNLKTAVQRILVGRNREEQTSFMQLRSHYLFESRFCTPGAGHEKGGVESDVGYARRNFLTPLPQVTDFAALNEMLQTACVADDKRQIQRSNEAIGVKWQAEKATLRPLPAHAFTCCVSREVTLNGYGQITFETNRYSVPAALARKRMTLRAYPFQIEVLADNQVIATHPRSYQKEGDFLDPLHYLSLLEQRPGAFEHAQPMRQWREAWPPAYEELLTRLRRQHESESKAIRIFVQILHLHQSHSPEQVEAAITAAVAEGLTTLEGVRFCLNRLLDPTPTVPPLDLSDRPQLAAVGQTSPDLSQYDRFLEGTTP